MIPAPGFFLVMFGRATPRYLAMLLITLLAGVCLAPAAVDDARLLAAIATWEASAGRIGPAGERGAYQLHPLTVRDRGGWGEQSARDHLAWLKTSFRRAGVDVLPFNLALAWNAGLSRVLRGRCHERHYAYARAVVALYDLPAGRSTARQLGVGDSSAGMSPAGISFVPVQHLPSGGFLTEHAITKAALCGGAGVSPAGAGGLGLNSDTPAAITCAVTGAVESRTGWPCRDTGHLALATTTTTPPAAGTLGRVGVSGRRSISTRRGRLESGEGKKRVLGPHRCCRSARA